jgi:hypothetical protein
VSSRLFVETKTDVDHKFGYQPARDINWLSIKNVVEGIEQDGNDDIPVANTEELNVLSESLKKLSEAMENSPANRLLKDI